MQIDINPLEYLSDEQKAAIGTQLCQKILQVIDQIEVGKPIDLSQILRDTVESSIDADMIFENLSLEPLAERLSERLVELIN